MQGRGRLKTHIGFQTASWRFPSNELETDKPVIAAVGFAVPAAFQCGGRAGGGIVEAWMGRGFDDAAAADASVCVGVKPDEYFAFLAVFKRGGGVGRAAQVGDDFVGGLVGGGEDNFLRGRWRVAA